MKRFEFSLNKLMGYKQQILDREKNNLAHLRRQQQQYIDEKNELEERLRRSSIEFQEKMAAGMTVLQVSTFKGYHQSLAAQIRELEDSIEKMEEKVQRQLKVVVEANKEVSSLEKLEDKQLEEYNFKVAKAEEQFIEEYVTNAAYRV
ncbi:MAG: flagellar export protein FliJ [Oscillospiraceae bacterium]|nr:flagellar export protein FliJ [Oscillospiraceae bacterium]